MIEHTFVKPVLQKAGGLTQFTGSHSRYKTTAATFLPAFLCEALFAASYIVNQHLK